jgi:hypothetical protein
MVEINDPPLMFVAVKLADKTIMGGRSFEDIHPSHVYMINPKLGDVAVYLFEIRPEYTWLNIHGRNDKGERT